MGNQDNLSVLIDWLSVTFPFPSSNTYDDMYNGFNFIQFASDILELEYEDFEYKDYGKWNYTQQAVHKHIKVYFNPINIDMGIFFEFSGTACREFEEVGNWVTLLQQIETHNANVTRLDIAIDDFSNQYFTLKQINNKIEKGHVVTKFRTNTLIKKRDYEKNILGETLYFGSQSSSIFIRIYNKLLERRCASYNVSSEVDFWLRTEIVLRDERASTFIKVLLIKGYEYLGSLAKAVLSQYINFVIPSKDSNRARWKTSPFWKKFLGDVEPLPLTLKTKETNITKKKEWIQSQVKKSLSMIFLSDVELFTDYITDLLNSSEVKIEKNDINLINEERMRNGLSMLERTDIFKMLNDLKLISSIESE